MDNLNNKICSVFGHSKIEEDVDHLKSKLNEVFINLIEEKGVGIFFFGGFGDFDHLCWEVVTELIKKYPFVKRVYCLEDVRYLRPRKRPKYLKDEDYEDFIYLDLDYNYWYTRIYYRNCEMIKQSDYVVFYIRNTENSGAYKAYKFARREKKEIFEV